MENSRSCEINNIDVNRASFAQRLGSTKHENLLKSTPSDLFNETNKTEGKKTIILNIWGK